MAIVYCAFLEMATLPQFYLQVCTACGGMHCVGMGNSE